MNFCSVCGAKVVAKVPPGDTLPRFVCEMCQAIHYQNPKIVVGCIATWDHHILLCKRAIEPQYGLWTIPAGFMENGESIDAAARRETLEEARAEVELGSLLGIFSLPAVNQVYVVFQGSLLQPVFGVGEESVEVELVSRQNIPWDQLAFRVIRTALRRYCENLESNRFMTHIETIPPHSGC